MEVLDSETTVKSEAIWHAYSGRTIRSISSLTEINLDNSMKQVSSNLIS